jgi:hypothetical protein
MRQRIRGISYAEMEEVGIFQRDTALPEADAAGNRPFTMNRHVRESLISL